MKSEVYSWRVSADLKLELEREARRRQRSLAAMLEMAAREWLERIRAGRRNDGEQIRLRSAASKCIGAIAGGDPERAESARRLVRKRLRRRNDC